MILQVGDELLPSYISGWNEIFQLMISHANLLQEWKKGSPLFKGYRMYEPDAVARLLEAEAM